MAYRRKLLAVAAPLPDELTARMVGIGMSLAAEPRVDADIDSNSADAWELGMLMLKVKSPMVFPIRDIHCR